MKLHVANAPLLRRAQAQQAQPARALDVLFRPATAPALAQPLPEPAETDDARVEPGPAPTGDGGAL